MRIRRLPNTWRVAIGDAVAGFLSLVVVLCGCITSFTFAGPFGLRKLRRTMANGRFVFTIAVGFFSTWCVGAWFALRLRASWLSTAFVLLTVAVVALGEAPVGVAAMAVNTSGMLAFPILARSLGATFTSYFSLPCCAEPHGTCRRPPLCRVLFMSTTTTAVSV